MKLARPAGLEPVTPGLEDRSVGFVKKLSIDYM
jgi:hypothetical protein